MDNLPTNILTFAHQLADAAGTAIRPYFKAHGAVETKGDQSPVTRADKAAESAMRTLILKQFPEHGIFGEEEARHLPEARYQWVLDPIDGTRAFIAGNDQWGTLIALCDDGVPILGLLDQPITGERWVGMQGEQTQFFSSHPEGELIQVRPCHSLAQATISTTSARYFTPEQAVRFARLAEQSGETIANGDCIAYGLLARGQRDLVVDAGLKPYDILALVPIINGAGGCITGWDGKPVTLTHFANVVAMGDAALAADAHAALHAS